MNSKPFTEYLKFKEKGHNWVTNCNVKTQTWENWSSYAKSWNQKISFALKDWTRIKRWGKETNARRNWKI